MNIAKKVAIATLSGLISLAAVSAGAAVDDPDDTVINDGSETGVALSASVSVLPQCEWTMAGVDTSISMTSADKYVGADLDISGTDDDGVNVHLGGNGVSGTACAIYRTGNAGVQLEVVINSSQALKFVGLPADGTVEGTSTMDWSIGAYQAKADAAGTGKAPLKLSASLGGTNCSAVDGWTVPLSAQIIDEPNTPDGPNDVAELVSISSSSVKGNYDTELDTPFTDLPTCVLGLTYATTVPAGLVPESAGPYTMTGPTMTVRLVHEVPAT